jgi:2,4-dienoyl-CoA reductase-like NADH-dependent reductase (Old Yellow Enzyme family)
MSQLASAIDIRQVHFKNKMIKGAMSEALANHVGQPNHLHLGLYEAWAKGGLGCAITGNVMVDFRAKNEPGVVVIETERDLEPLKQWAARLNRPNHRNNLVVHQSQCPVQLN